MKLLTIAGSPRRGGNSESLLDQLIKGAQSAGNNVEKIVLSELKFVGCQACGGCRKSGKCVIDDDMQDVYRKIAVADAIVVASPIFFGSLPAQVKAMIDRYQCLWVLKYVLKKEAQLKVKKGYLILTSGSSQDKFFQNAESIIKNFFSVLGIKLTARLYCPEVDDKKAILQHPEYLKEVLKLGKKIN